MQNSENSKRIALNTILLYFRMFITMGIALYTSRIVLNTLGIEDFGIYNVVGGVVMMFSFLNASMSTATQRFLSFEIGKKNLDQLKKTFSMSINIHVIIATVVFIFAETIGLWFLNTKLVIPIDRLEAANWVYHFANLALFANIIRVPFNSLIIAHERMKIFAYISVFDAVLKLLIVLLLMRVGFDKLKVYSFLIFLVATIIFFIYWIYTRKEFKEIKYTFLWDKALFDKLYSFFGWNLIGAINGVASQNGLNILLNLFFGPTINAARGIAFQVSSAVNGFVSNFQLAMYPQIVKSYAKGDTQYMHNIIFKGAKYSFFLLFFITLPILLETEIILQGWLIQVPEYTVIFCRLVIINILIDCISGSLMSGAQASGKIKYYQIIVGGLLLLVVPISYSLLLLDYPPESTFYVCITISLMALFARLFILKYLINLSFSHFIREVVLVVIGVSFIGVVLPLIIRLNFDSGVYRLIIVTTTSVLSISISVYLLGLKKVERVFINSYLILFKKNIVFNFTNWLKKS